MLTLTSEIGVTRIPMAFTLTPHHPTISCSTSLNVHTPEFLHTVIHPHQIAKSVLSTVINLQSGLWSSGQRLIRAKPVLNHRNYLPNGLDSFCLTGQAILNHYVRPL